MNRVKLTPAQKSLVLQNVHCTKYLKACRCQFWLERREQGDAWYGVKRGADGRIVARPTANQNTWFHNRKFEIKDKVFEGVVVKIGEENFSTLLGVCEQTGRPVPFGPCKRDGIKILVATVFFQNGKKRLVPLRCIKECEDFDDGAELLLINENLEKYAEQIPRANRIATSCFRAPDAKADSQPTLFALPANVTRAPVIVSVENTYYSISADGKKLAKRKRSLRLDVLRQKVAVRAEAANEWFDIADEEYGKILEIMRAQIKAQYKFEPQAQYGDTNFERLVNFCRFPFAPALNMFVPLFSRRRRGAENALTSIDEIAPSAAKLVKELQKDPNCVPKFIEWCGLRYSPKTNRIFLRGHLPFAEYLGLAKAGFTDENVIETLMAGDEDRIFARCVFLHGAIGRSVCGSVDFFFTDKSDVIGDAAFLLDLYRGDNKKAGRLLLERLLRRNGCEKDALRFMQNLKTENLLSKEMTRKIGNEGLTEYNHDMLMRAYIDAHPEQKKSDCASQSIEYTREEKRLEWETRDYSFRLPENTDRLIDIGAKMNICVGHLYKEKAVEKRSTIVYAKKQDKYVLCIEVNKSAGGRFRLVQRSAFNNREPKGEDLAAFKGWCVAKQVG